MNEKAEAQECGLRSATLRSDILDGHVLILDESIKSSHEPSYPLILHTHPGFLPGPSGVRGGVRLQHVRGTPVERRLQREARAVAHDNSHGLDKGMDVLLHGGRVCFAFVYFFLVPSFSASEHTLTAMIDSRGQGQQIFCGGNILHEDTKQTSFFFLSCRTLSFFPPMNDR